MKAVDLIFEPVAMPLPWQAYRLGVSQYPTSPGEATWLLPLVVLLSNALRKVHRVEPTLWLDTAELHQDGGSRIFSKNARVWSPTMGFAFDPTGPAPRTIEMADLMDADYGTPLKIFNRSAIFVSQLKQTMSAYRALAGRGLATMLYFSADAPEGTALASSANAFITHSCEVLQPMMHEGAFQNYGFYLPLLSSKSMQKIESQRLQTWLGNTEVYLREASEDKEIFLLARRDLSVVFEALGMRRLSVSDGAVPWALTTSVLEGVAS